MEEEARLWFRQAGEDLKTARVLLQGGRHYAASYFAQQVAEKALKALLFIRKGQPPRRTHDLRELGEEAELPTEWLTSLTELSAVYLISRYPDITPSTLPAETVDYEESRGHVELAEKVLQWARQRSEIR